jgi:hypothetical protein
MVIISASVVSRTKTLVSRQYLEVSRSQVEGLLSTFQKLIDKEKSDHTFFETENVRFVYHPLESNLFILLITTRGSNIVEDLETLKLLSRLTTELAHSNEEQILSKAFDLIFSFDEVISFGYREPVTSAQVTQYVEMESHEERLHQMIQQSKEAEAREISKRKQTELAEARRKKEREERISMPSLSSQSASETHIDSSPSAERMRREEDAANRQAQLLASIQRAPQPTAPTVPVGQWNPSMNADVVDYSSQTASAPKKGMTLGARR